MRTSIGLTLALFAAACAPESEQELPFAPEPSALESARNGAATPATFRLDTQATPGALRVQISGATPNSRVELLTAQGVGDGSCANQRVCLAIEGRLRTLGFIRTDARGNAVARFVGRRFSGQELAFQALSTTGVSNPTRVRVPDGLARLRATHASPDAPTVDVYANGALVVEDLAYASTSDWLAIPPGDYTIALRAANADPASPPAYEAEITADADAVYTAVAAGELSRTDDAALRLQVFAHDFDAPKAGEFRTVISHFATTAPTVALDVGNDGSLDLPSVAPWVSTGAEGIALPSQSSLAVGVKLPDGAPVTSFTLPALSTGEEAFVVATGFLGDVPESDRNFGLLAILRDGTTVFVEPDPIVYALHASPGAPPVDIRVGGATLAGDLAYGEVTAAIQVPPGSYPLNIVGLAGNAEIDVGTFDTPALAPGNRYFVVASGLVGGAPAFQLLPFAANFTGGADQASITFVHASPDVPAVDIGLAGPPFTGVLFDVAFGESDPESIDLPAGDYALAAAIAGNSDAALTFPSLPLGAGDRYFAVAAGLLGDSSFELMLVDTTSAAWTVTPVAPN